MKKTFKFIPLLAVGALLSACDLGTNTGKDPSLTAADVPNGTAVTATVAKTKMNEAVKAMTNEDAIGISMEDAFLHYSLSVEKTIPTQKDNTTSIAIEKHTNIDHAGFSVGVRGLTSTSLEELNGSATAKATFDIGGSISMPDFEKTYSAPGGTYGFGAYLQGNKTYLDFSNTSFQALLETKVDEKNEYRHRHGQSEETIALDNKVVFDNGLTDADLPITSQENLTAWTTSVSQKIERIASKGGKLQALQHDDGSYSYSVNALSLKDAGEFVDELDFDEAFEFETDDDEDEVEFGGIHFHRTTSHEFNVNTYGVAFVFDEEGISSIGTSIDVTYRFEDEFTINGVTYGTKVAMNYTLNAKVNFLLGTEVTIESPEEPEGYTEITLSRKQLKELMDIID